MNAKKLLSISKWLWVVWGIQLLCFCPEGKSTGLSLGEDQSDPEHYDVVAVVTPLRVRAMTSQSVVDAIGQKLLEKGYDGTEVIFEIRSVLKGRFEKVEAGGSSDEKVDKKFLSIAVAYPEDTFGIVDWENPGNQRYQVFLRCVPDVPRSYILVKAEPKK